MQSAVEHQRDLMRPARNLLRWFGYEFFAVSFRFDIGTSSHRCWAFWDSAESTSLP
jgi:hypothetical protein